MGGNRRDKRMSLRRNVVFCILGFILAVAAFMIASRYEDASRVQERGVSTANIGVHERIEHNGKTYVEETGITTILIMGIDGSSESERYGARQGGQSDFMMLMVIDHPDNEVHLLQIDRDTIAEVETFGILGNPIGTKAMQICLAHSFGNSEEQSCKVAQNAVSNLLQGIDIDFYISVNMDSMALLNKTLRGVPVTLEDDFSEFDPMMTEGAEITLTDEQAEIFMRARMEIGDGTNASRMRRHRMFINNAMEKFKRLASEDADYINTAYEEMESALNMDISKARLLNEANRAYRYEIRPIKTLDGSYMVGDDGFIEFHADETSIVNWIVETLFREE